MREMKDSGIEWIGEIPAKWDVCRCKNVMSILSRPITQEDEIITCFRDGEVTLRKNRREDGFTVAEKEVGYQGIDPGDLVVHGMDGFAGSIGISDSRGKATPVLNVLDSSENKRYLMYYLRALAYKEVYLALSTGIRVRSCNLNWKKLSELPCLIPGEEEQLDIARFLDKKCAEIDAAIAAAEASIEEYELYRKSVIFQAVTKGLDDFVEMKDSGIEWIGEIPIEWDLTRIADLFGRRNETVSDVDYGPLSVTKQGVLPQLGHVAKSDDHANRKLVLAGDFAINSRSDRRNSCGFAKQDGSVSTINLILVPKRGIEPRYFDYVFDTVQFGDEFYSYGHGIVADLWTTNWTDMKKIRVPLPPIEEQGRIADHLDKTISHVKEVVRSKKGVIEELKAYKKSLIYEVVTGKREVR